MKRAGDLRAQFPGQLARARIRGAACPAGRDMIHRDPTAFAVQLVGQPAQPVRVLGAYSAMHAVAQAAGCDVTTVCLPIWRAEPDPWHQRYGVECFMPRDDSGRQWLVRAIPEGAPVMPDTKLSAVQAAMAAGDWRRAIALAARFPRLGAERDAILDAHTAYTNPGFVRGLRKDPEALKAAGQAALTAKYVRE